MKPPRGVILDIDGTLVASNDAHAHAWVDALAERGIKVAFEEVRRRIGMGGDKLLPVVSGIQEDTPEGKALSKRRKEFFQARYFPHLQPTPGAHELLKRLYDDGLKLVVATSAKKDEVRKLLHVCGGDQYIGAKTSADDVERSKPDPDVMGAALKESGLKADQVIMLGDTPYDIEAANRAGVAVIAVRCGGWSDRDPAGAIAVYDDPADLLAHLDSSPLTGGTP
jgi:HAD superfamily hydrolase (TIGR01509 family)